MLSEAIQLVGKLLDSYPNRSTAPDSYIGALAATLRQYPRSIALQAAHPLHGVARTSKFLPTIADIVAFCDPHVEALWRQVRREKQIEAQLAERDAPDTRDDVEKRRAVVERISKELAQKGMHISGQPNVIKDDRKPFTPYSHAALVEHYRTHGLAMAPKPAAQQQAAE